MVIFWRLILGHLLADFTFQTNLINSWKRKSVWGMLVHCAMHPFFYILLTYPYLNQFWVYTKYVQLQGWTCILLIFVLHFLEDQWRVYTIQKFRTPDNTLYLIWDQVIHYACIFLFFPLSLLDSNGTIIPEKWTVLGCLFIGATHFTTVMIYFLEKDFLTGSFPEFDEKYLAIAERLVLALFFLLPGTWWVFFALLWIGHMYYLRSKRIVDFSWFSFYVGVSAAVVFGVLARLVYYS
ncbi:MAG: DUF3307 domain-containing protein [Elusimicrobia bacterium]|nr:DUF3307 domain-containing protein [Elusimicrobiota bacterium]